MAIVVEITDRSGRVKDHFVVAKPNASIGRSYANDVVIHDPYVDAVHLRIENSLEGLQLEVVNDSGHTVVNKSLVGSGRRSIGSGTHVVLGKTHVRILLSTHEVAPTLNFERVDRVFTGLARPATAIFLTVLYLMLTAGHQYMETFSEIQWSRWIMQLVSPLFAAIMWTSVWALVTRVSRGESRFFHHWVVVLITLTVVLIWGYFMEVVVFNVGDHWLIDVLVYGLFGVLLASMFWLHLRFAFSQRPFVRQITAHGFAWAIVAYAVLSTFSFTYDFQSYPEYQSALLPPELLFIEPTKESDFLRDSEALFEFTEEEISRD